MARSAYQKLKPLYIMNYLLQNSDEEHMVSVSQLIDYLAAQGIASERKSIYDDIEALRFFGIDIVQGGTGKNIGYYIANRSFELPELKLLVDSVQTSKFITHKKTATLIRKIETLASVHEAQLLDRQVFVKNRIKTMNESIYYNIDAIQTGISQNKKIQFKYFEYTIEKTRRYRKDGAFYVVSPFAMTWDDENYYLVAYDSDAEIIKHYRVDKMTQITTTEQLRDGLGAYQAIVHIHDLRAFGHRRRICECDADVIIAYPGLRGESKDLLEILLPIDRYRIGFRTVSFRGQSGLDHLCPCGPSTVNILRCGQDLVGTLEFHAGQRGIDFKVIDIPVAQQITPQRNLSAVIALIFIFKAQFLQAARGITVCNDADHFGIAADLIGQILDALTLRYDLRDTFNIRIYAICRDFDGLAVTIHMVIIGINEFTHTAIDGQVAQRIPAVVDVHLTERCLFRVGCVCSDGEHAKQHDDCEEHGYDSFFHRNKTSVFFFLWAMRRHRP